MTNKNEWVDGLRGKCRLVEQHGKWTIREFIRPWGDQIFEVTASDDVLGAFTTLEEVHAAIASEKRFL